SPDAGFSTSRREFIGRHGSIFKPKSAAAGAALSGSVEQDGDPCAVLSQDLTLAPGEEKSVLFYLGDADSTDAAKTLVKDIRKTDFDATVKANLDFWSDFTGRLQVQTPDRAFNHLVNRWLPYQALSCRIM